MDNPGWHARRRAARQDEAALTPSRGPDGQFRPVAQLEPMEDAFVGGWALPPPLPPKPDRTGNAGAQFGVPVPPLYTSPRLLQSGYPFVDSPTSRGPPVLHGVRSSFDQNPLSRLSPVERSQTLHLRKKMMNPYLQFMCGPLLRYDTVDRDGVWHGAALIVTADSGSTYEPYPTLRYFWDPRQSASAPRQPSSHGHGAAVVDLGPHPADPMAQHFHNVANDEPLEGPTVLEKSVVGTEIYVYGGRSGTYTFWRFLIQIPLTDSEMKIKYSVNGGLEMDFFVPARRQTMRLAAYSCNGFSAGVNPDDFRGPGFQSGYDPVWVDLLAKHAEQPFHALVGGGDQLYCDGVTREPELQHWINHSDPEGKKQCRLTQEILSAIDRFYFNHYCEVFRSGAFARANSTMIGSRGYFFYLLFQCFINVSIDGFDDRSHVFKSTIIGGPGAFVPFPSHSVLTPIGPTAWILLLDCRAERMLTQVCSEEEYRRVFKRMSELPPGVEHLIIQLGIPIAYPRMVFLESVLSSKFNPLVTLGRHGSLGLKGFVNQFNGDAELLDDLAERNLFVERLQQFALERRIRITFLAGDVHCAAVGVLKTLHKGKGSSSISPSSDFRYMLNIVTSTPPDKVIALVNSLSTKRHRTMHHVDTDEEMVALFQKDTDGSKPKSHYIMGRRNWCSITLKEPSGDLSFDIRVEKAKGRGETVG
ncbi:hypothetical protein F5148DRAFT_1274284 [Russula earlei]|uniref:Uncharacterized protein n=1 Tax=Russula earlei TaxID=71964 RepID=A0ACC0UIA5_9AGAM|nr:hypothetical protein F5148DRAFT_1274284 [Russula earlei]